MFRSVIRDTNIDKGRWQGERRCCRSGRPTLAR